MLFVGGTDNTSNINSVIIPTVCGIFRPYSSTRLSDFGAIHISSVLGSSQ